MLKTPLNKFQKGNIGEYIQQLKAGIEERPHEIDGYLLLGTILIEQGAYQEAIHWLTRLLKVRPQNESALFYIANAFKEQRLFDEARSYYERAIKTNSRFAEAYNNLGVVLAELGQTERALKEYARAIAADPLLGQAYFNMGNLLLKSGKRRKAESCYLKAIEINPEDHRSLNNLGNLRRNDWELEKARSFYKRALASSPDSSETLHNLGDVLRLQGHYHEAISLYERAIEVKPDAVVTYVSLGNTYRSNYDFDRAISCYESALNCNPKSIPALDGLGICFADCGKTNDALRYFDSMAALRDDFGTRVKRAMILPIIYQSTIEILDARRKFSSELAKLSRFGETIEDPYKQIGISNFILALHGINERPIREMLAKFYLTICPQLAWSSPLLKRGRQKNKIRLGFVGRYLHNHTIGRLYGGMIERLDRTKFDLFIFRFDHKNDKISRSIDHCAREVTLLPQDMFKARERIAEAKLDILFFPEIGMDPLTYFIAFSRLAPVQCKRGFQITMGIPTIDYFISSDAAEPTEAQQYYSENLVRLKGTGYYYHRPERPNVEPERESFSLPEDRVLYVCTQSLFKLHPDFDPILSAILQKDPRGVLVLMEGMYPHWKELLLKRFKKTVPGIVERICFVPRQPRDRFMTLHLLADAVIDTIYFSGGHTSLECFAWGIPVVTWPSAMLPGRLTYGFYQKMGVLDCVAKDFSDYVDIAYRLANDRGWRQAISRKILERSSILFENSNDIKELELFFEKAVNDAYRADSD